MGGHRAEPTGDAVAALAARQRLLYRAAYVGVAVVIVAAWLTRPAFEAGFVVVACGVFLLPVLQLRSRTVLRSDDGQAAVRNDFGTPRNPLTRGWFETADRVEDDPEVSHVVLEVSTRFGTLENVVDVQPVAGDARRLTIERDGDTVADTTVEVEPDDDGSRVEVSSRRPAIKPLEVVVQMVLTKPVVRMLEEAGYTVESTSSSSVRPRNPF